MLHCNLSIFTHYDQQCRQFYAQINETLGNISDSDKIILLGDFNARIGIDNNTWKNVIGNFGTGKCNSNGELLLETCTEHQLVITNTCFKHKDIHKHSWMHPRSKHWHLIDFIITRQSNLSDFMDTRAMRGANCSTDHIMIRSTTRLEIHKQFKKKGRNLEDWARSSCMSFNAENCAIMVFGCQQQTPDAEYTIVHKSLSVVQETKYLGVTIQTDVKFINHINDKLSKSKRQIGMIKQIV